MGVGVGGMDLFSKEPREIEKYYGIFITFGILITLFGVDLLIHYLHKPTAALRP